MELPTQVRFEKKVKRRLSAASDKTGISQVDLIRFAVDKLLAEHGNHSELLDAYIRARSEKISSAAA